MTLNPYAPGIALTLPYNFQQFARWVRQQHTGWFDAALLRLHKRRRTAPSFNRVAWRLLGLLCCLTAAAVVYGPLLWWWLK